MCILQLGDNMNSYFLAECTPALREGLLANEAALMEFQSYNFFKQRSLSNYVVNAENENERVQRVNEVLAKLMEQSKK